MIGARRLGPALLLATFAVALPARADKAACVASYERAQQLKMAKKLRDAKKELLACSNPECPASLRNDCTAWLAEVDATLPSLVVVATDASGNDVADVRVSIDGALAAERLDGTEIPIDPGEHTIRFEHGNSPPVEKKVVARAGEKLRRIPVAFTAPAPSSPPPPSAPPAPEPPHEEAKPAGGGRTLAYVIGGIGVAGVAAGAVTGVLALGKKSTVDEQCPNHACTPEGKSALDSGRTYGTISTIAFGVGVVGLGAAAYLLFTAPPANATGAASFRPIVAGDARSAYAGLGGAF